MYMLVQCAKEKEKEEVIVHIGLAQMLIGVGEESVGAHLAPIRFKGHIGGASSYVHARPVSYTKYNK